MNYNSATHHWAIALNEMDQWSVELKAIGFHFDTSLLLMHSSTINAVLHFCNVTEANVWNAALVWFPGQFAPRELALLLLLVNSYSKSVGPCSSCRLSLFSKVQIFVTKQLFFGAWCMWIDWSTYCRNFKSDSNQLVLGVPADWVSLQEFKYLWYCGSECGACVKLVNFLWKV